MSTVFETPNVHRKLQLLPETIHHLLGNSPLAVPCEPARSGSVVAARSLNKSNLNTPEGQAATLHGLASIELQAMELGLRTLAEFDSAPRAFREELAAITLSEGEHLRLCLEGLEQLGYQFGDFPVHLALWQAVASHDSLLDRILIVHRYLEGAGLDAGDQLLRRLQNTSNHRVLMKPLQVIAEEEVGHVEFGSRWFREVAQQSGLEAQNYYEKGMRALYLALPKRIPIQRALRLQAGFTPQEVDYLIQLQQELRSEGYAVSNEREPNSEQ